MKGLLTLHFRRIRPLIGWYNLFFCKVMVENKYMVVILYSRFFKNLDIQFLQDVLLK